MPYANSGDVRLYYEEAGKGTPIVFVHEYADDLYGWEPQLRYFSRRYRCIAYNARGYAPSDVPKPVSKYSQAIATDDIASVMRHLKIAKAHIIGCSMGGYATVHFGLRYPRMAMSLTAIGVGFGSDPDKRDEFLRDVRYPLVPENESNGIVWITITRYILTPLQYDATLAPTSYKLRVLVDVQMVDRSTNQTLWEEKNLEGTLTYPNATLTGGLTEEQARENIWAILAPMIVKRVVNGFGAVTGTSERRITGDAPSTAPAATPEKPITPAVPAPY